MGTAFYPGVGEAVEHGHGSSTGGPRQASLKGMDKIYLSLGGLLQTQAAFFLPGKCWASSAFAPGKAEDYGNEQGSCL